MLELNKIYNVDCLDGLSKLDDESIDLIITSHHIILVIIIIPEQKNTIL